MWCDAEQNMPESDTKHWFWAQDHFALLG